MGRSLGMSKPPPARFWGHGPNHLLIRAKNVVKTAIFNPHLTYSLHTFFGFFFTLAHQLDQVLPPWGKKSWGTPFCDSVGILSIANLDSFYLVKLKPAKLAIIRIAAGRITQNGVPRDFLPQRGSTWSNWCAKVKKVQKKGANYMLGVGWI